METSRDLQCLLDREEKCPSQTLSRVQCDQSVSCKHFASCSFPRARLRKEACEKQSLQATEWEVGEGSVELSTKTLGHLTSAEEFREIGNKG